MQLNPWMQTIALAASNTLTCQPVQAQTAPVQGAIGVKWMNYQETQGSLERIRVQARSTFVTLPLPQNLALDATQTVDVISGASPAYYTEARTFTPMQDVRRAHDLRLSWYNELQNGHWDNHALQKTTICQKAHCWPSCNQRLTETSASKWACHETKTRSTPSITWSTTNKKPLKTFC